MCTCNYYQGCIQSNNDDDYCDETKGKLPTIEDLAAFIGETLDDSKVWKIENPFYHWCRALVHLSKGRQKEAESSYEYYQEYIDIIPIDIQMKNIYININELQNIDERNMTNWKEISNAVDTFSKDYDRKWRDTNGDQSVLAETFYNTDTDWYRTYKLLTVDNVNSLSAFQKSLNKINRDDKDYTFDYRFCEAIVSINMNDMRQAKKLINDVRNAISSSPKKEQKRNKSKHKLLENIEKSKNIQLKDVELWDEIKSATSPEKNYPVLLVYKNKYNYSTNLFSSNDNNYKKTPRIMFIYNQENPNYNIVYPGGRYLIVPNTEFDANSITKKNVMGGVALLGLSYGVMSLNK